VEEATNEQARGKGSFDEHHRHSRQRWTNWGVAPRKTDVTFFSGTAAESGMKHEDCCSGAKPPSISPGPVAVTMPAGVDEGTD